MIMADIVKQTKEQERAELHKSIWRIAEDLRGMVDGWDFKTYVLGTLFYRYISENIAKYINDLQTRAGVAGFCFADLDDEKAERVRQKCVDEKGYYIKPSELFCNVLGSASSDENLNTTLQSIFAGIEGSSKGSHSENNFKGLFNDLDTNSNKLGSTTPERCRYLVKLLQGIASIKFEYDGNAAIDAFGDAYEYLMAMYASGAGKSGGEYFTPQEVSELLARIAVGDKKSIDNAYDPACGSAGLLLQIAKILGYRNVGHFFGQEKNITTYNLSRINMFLHGVEPDRFDFAHGDTLINPALPPKDPNKEYEVIVSNPPYSVKWAGDGNLELLDDDRFKTAGVLAPKSKGDMAFVMHCLHWLAPHGKAAIVCFPGIMYRGGAEQKIRKYLIDNDRVEAIIQLPDNLFFGTSIATCIMVLTKGKCNVRRNKTLFIDASKYLIKSTNSNKLSDANISDIYKLFADAADVDYTAKLVENSVIVEQDYNLSVSTYVEAEDTREKVDITELNAEIAGIVANVDRLRKSIDDIVAEIEGGGGNE
jgi:type I restriction enzyme M protein